MSMPGYFPRDFVTGAAIGRGRTRPADIRKLRRSLDELDYLRSPATAKPAYTTVVADAVERFQRDFGLKPDGAIDPDGPTEQTLNLTLAAKREGGVAGLATARNETLRLNREGLRLTRDSVNPGALGVWRDKTGKRVKEAKLADPPRSTPTAQGTRLLGLPTDRSDAERPEIQLAQSNSPAPVGHTGSAGNTAANPNASSSRQNDKSGFIDLAAPPYAITPSPNDRMNVYRSFAKGHRWIGNEEAGNLLDHYLDGSGSPIWFSPEKALSFEPIREHQRIVQGHFEKREFIGKTGDNAYNKRITGLRDGQTIIVGGQSNYARFNKDDYTKEILKGNLNFPLAFGETNIESTAAFHVTRRGNKLHIEGTVIHRWNDKYDFKEGGSGADGALALEKSHGAKPFEFGANWKQTFKGTVEINNGALSKPQIKWSDKITDIPPK